MLCVSSTLAIGEAARLVREGAVDIALCGGSEAWITPLGIGSFALLHALSTSRNDAPEAASRPFAEGRDGFVPAEGAGALVLESREHATRRGVTTIAAIAGVGPTNDAHHPVAPCPDAREAARSIAMAMCDAGVAPEQIDYVNAHGTSTPLNDVAETQALKLALGPSAQRVNLHVPDPQCGLDYVPEGARSLRVRTALKTSFGFGGRNVALVLTSPPS